MSIYSCIGLRKSVLSRPICGYDFKNNVSFKKWLILSANQRWIMNFLDVGCLTETKTFEHFSDFLAFYFSSKNSNQSGLNQPTYLFDHSTESLKWGAKDRTWVGGLSRLWRPKKMTKHFTAKFSGHGYTMLEMLPKLKIMIHRYTHTHTRTVLLVVKMRTKNTQYFWIFS